VLQKLSAEQINALLEAVNYRGEQLELCTIPHYEKDAYCIQKLCSQAGIEVRVSLLTPDVFKGPKRLEADMILFALVLDNDTELRLIDLYKSMQLHLKPSIRDDLEGKVAAILSEPSPIRRKLQFQEIEHLLIDEGWIHFLYQKHQRTIYHSSVKGIPLDSLDWVEFKDIWFK
jgi:SgrR family transcriptional regulator